MWHGYLVLEKPGSLTPQEWQTALVDVYAELDESPDDPQPARRLHTRRWQNKSIVESVFDPLKLNSEFLSGLVGAPMARHTLSFRKHQSWRESGNVCRDYIEDGWDWDLMSRTFYPEDYGADGTAAGDTQAIQDAIDDGISVGGGVVRLSKTYRLQMMGSVPSAITPSDYALWVNGDNLFIEGPGKLLLETKPDSQRFTAIYFGNGGSVVGQPGEDGTWIYNVGIRGVTIDASALSNADLLDIGAMIDAAAIGFHYCKHWSAQDCTIIKGWGWDATLKSAASSRRGMFLGNNIIQPMSRTSIWCDGARDVRVIGNCIKDANRGGIVLQSNLDNGEAGHSRRNIVAQNIIDRFSLGISDIGIRLTGSSENLVEGNYLVMGGNGHFIEIWPHAYLHGKAPSDRNAVMQNYFSGGGIAAIRIFGYDENVFDGTPLEVRENFVSGNYAHSSLVLFCQLGEQARSNVIVNNFIGPSNDFDINPTAAENIVEPNIRLP